jgi:hypothetical protein
LSKTDWVVLLLNVDCVGSNETFAVEVNAVLVEFSIAEMCEVVVSFPGRLLSGINKRPRF